MRKVLIIIIIASLFGGCVSVNKYNSNLNVLRNEKQLKSDVDYIYKKLQRLNPRLDWHISEKDLDFKFDSLKSSINTPMTSNDFYFKLSPIIASVKQGHMRVFPLNKKMKIKETFTLQKSGTSPLSRFDFESFDNKLYIVKNNSGDKSVETGTEVVTVNNIKPMELISRYSNTFSSDGFNHTFIDRRISKDFPTYFYYQNDITDSVICQLKYNDTIKTVCMKRIPTIVSVKKEKTIEQIAGKREQNRKENRKREETWI